MNEEIKKELETKIESISHSIEYDTPLEVWKNKYDELLKDYVNSGHLYNYLVKCDEENNIYLEKDIKIVDIYIEPKRGLGIFVNQITILKSGAIQEEDGKK